MELIMHYTDKLLIISFKRFCLIFVKLYLVLDKFREIIQKAAKLIIMHLVCILHPIHHRATMAAHNLGYSCGRKASLLCNISQFIVIAVIFFALHYEKNNIPHKKSQANILTRLTNRANIFLFNRRLIYAKHCY